jgi:hypothetical protein
MARIMYRLHQIYNTIRKNTVMKKINIILALIILSIGINVYADDKSGKKINTRSQAESGKIIKAFDAEMKLEKWMTEIKEFTLTSDIFTEEEMSLESWMSNEFDCCSDFFTEEEVVMETWMTESFITEKDVEMQLEDWMLQSF